MTDQFSSHQDVLAFWRAIEYLPPASPEDPTHKSPRVIRKPDDREGVWDIVEEADLPWNPGLAAYYAPTDKEIWRFVLTLGFSPVDDAMDELREMLGHLPDDAERPGGGGEMALVSLVVDSAGFFTEAAAIAPMPWAMGRLRTGAHPFTLQDFPAFEVGVLERLTALLAPEDDEEGEAAAITLPDMRAVCDLVTEAAGWRPRKDLQLLARVRAVRLSVRKDGTFGEAEPDILGSFIADDLTRVHSALARNEVGAALTAYLSGLSAGSSRTDVIAAPAASASWLSPSLLPAARWPSKPHEKLVTAQQLAVNAALEKLKDEKGGLFSVNGPPGTGKTTLLRDLVAAIILERAKVLARLDSPDDVFIERVSVEGNSLWTLHPDVKGYEMVVASTNNGAVENVTVELPGLKAIDSVWAKECSHFAQVARTLLDPEPGEEDGKAQFTQCWALVAAVLGNRRNRSRFVNRFWWVEPGRKNQQGKPQPSHWMNFKSALGQLGRHPPDWNRARAIFEQRLAEVEALLNPAKTYDTALAKLRGMKDLDAAWGEMERAIDAHLALRPGVADVLLRPGSWLSWLRNGGILRDRYEAMTRQLVDLGVHVRGRGLASVTSRRAAVRDMVRRMVDEVVVLRAALPADMVVADTDFFAQAADDREKASPWLSDAVEQARKRCFLAALDLHRAFLAGAQEKVMANLRQSMDMLRGKLSPSACGKALEDVWASLFLAVLVVSTTFASFPRLFAGMKRESLGWLLVDEAGQATPQAAVGALWRSKRAIIIGDPLQIEPVVPLPSSVIEALRQKCEVSTQWLPVENSAQVLADRANALGGWIGRTWVGSPLRVHRRCCNPMFTVANAIAYDNLMVYGDVPDEAMPLGPSRWLDVGGAPADNGHFIPDQALAALDLLRPTAGRLDGVFVITPFRTVAQGMKDAARKAGLPQDWIRRNIGTVHTFQGKEAPMVILLLGGNPRRQGAFDWAAAKPNLLNVAVTRAKRAVYVIGDRGRWRQLPYFDRLDRELN